MTEIGNLRALMIFGQFGKNRFRLSILLPDFQKHKEIALTCVTCSYYMNPY